MPQLARAPACLALWRIAMAKSAATRILEQLRADPALAARVERMIASEPTPAIVRTPRDLAEVLRPLLFGREYEALAIVGFDRRRKVIGAEILTVGSSGFTIVDPAQCFRWALRLDRGAAHAIALAHNHPSGDPTPSEPDREITRRVAAAGKLLGIQVLDHIVWTDKHDRDPVEWNVGSSLGTDRSVAVRAQS
jgi:DNA repair protein RadC